MKNMGNMLKQAQKLQSRILKMQEELANEVTEGSAGGGMVKAAVNGKSQVMAIHIEKEVVDPGDVEMLQDLVMAAVNDALAKSRQMMDDRMSSVIPPGMNIPGMM
ncbi:MAG: YbaB/EbfC family nucleoid-associated protein [Desulfobacterales bacterium]|nr:MAG: YbaB/EbfC family nucleoid-associated protein [Desulfobacterales bacterium]